MPSPRTEIDARPDAAAEKPRTTLTVTQVVAGALAAVSAAVLASFFGVAGTVIGAALVSVVSTVGSALYSTSLSRTTERLRRTREAPVPPPGAPATRELPPALDPRRAPAPRRRPRWARVAAYAAAVFVVAMAVVTGIELVGQQPVSALVGGSDRGTSSTTIGELSTASSGRDVTPPDTGPAPPTTDAPTTDAPTTDAPPTGTPDDDADPTPTPDDDTDEPAPATGSEPADPSDTGEEDAEPTAPAEPSTQAPQVDPGPGAAPTG
jgi:hypothetical protein